MYLLTEEITLYLTVAGTTAMIQHRHKRYVIPQSPPPWTCFYGSRFPLEMKANLRFIGTRLSKILQICLIRQKPCLVCWIGWLKGDIFKEWKKSAIVSSEHVEETFLLLKSDIRSIRWLARWRGPGAKTCPSFKTYPDKLMVHQFNKGEHVNMCANNLRVFPDTCSWSISRS